ncbi:hypothetical protein C0583_06105 [Candidatus Parcubacteria bacterium]|nr:MAG: hypothetical protein C0583_06105 [Candidatus Parcubacteria bacterium]
MKCEECACERFNITEGGRIDCVDCGKIFTGDISKETERCVVCGKDTGILVTTPVYLRKNYIPGGGQTCGCV